MDADRRTMEPMSTAEPTRHTVLAETDSAAYHSLR